MVLETEAECLVVRDLEGVLERGGQETRMKIVPTFPILDLPGTKALSPVGPLTICGGTISGCPSYSYVQESGSLFKRNYYFQSGIKDHSSSNTSSNDKATKNGQRSIIEKHCAKQ